MSGTSLNAGSPLLLYDGVCALCNGAVTFVLERDSSRSVRFAPLQGDTAARFIADHPELSGIDSMIWVEADGRALTRSAAALAIARHVGGGWAALGSLSRIVPAPVRDATYDLIARVRYRLFGRYDACPVPPAEHRARFLP
jgi:predicted DCC family thiol-disulfide oxidoreductase YuxK